MTSTILFIYVVIFLAFLFDFINGFHDAANSIATLIATGALKPFQAVAWAAFFNFIAFLFFHLKVANTIGAGLIVPHIVTPSLIFAALGGAIIWNLFTWYLGLPSSSSHALIGGLLGAALIGSGWKSLEWHGLLPVLIALILSPILGLLISFLSWHLTNYYLQRKNHLPLEKWANRLQFLAGAFLSLGHGGNDAQKTMGIIAILLFSSGLMHGAFHVPFWVVISCNFVMALGTLAGGWRIVKTLGEKITVLTPLSGTCAMGSAALTLISATDLGIPVSTTHIVTGAVIGVGGARNWLGVNWVIIKRILVAWFLTLPAAAIVAALIFLLEKMI